MDISALTTILDKGRAYQESFTDYADSDLALLQDRCCLQHCSAYLSRADVNVLRALLYDNTLGKAGRAKSEAIRLIVLSFAVMQNNDILLQPTVNGRNVCHLFLCRLVNITQRRLAKWLEEMKTGSSSTMHAAEGSTRPTTSTLHGCAHVLTAVHDNGQDHPCSGTMLPAGVTKRKERLAISTADLLSRAASDEMLVMRIDGMGKHSTKLPALIQRPKSVDDVSRQNVDVYGVQLSRLGEDGHQFFNLAMLNIFEAYGGGSHQACSYILHSLNEIDLIPRRLLILADNAALMKSKIMHAFYGWILLNLPIDEITAVHFSVGHTHCEVDAFFGSIVKRLRQHNAYTPEELAKVIGMVGNTRVLAMPTQYNFSVLGQCVNEYSNRSRQRYFRFFKTDGVVRFTFGGELPKDLITLTEDADVSAAFPLFKADSVAALRNLLPPQLFPDFGKSQVAADTLLKVCNAFLDDEQRKEITQIPLKLRDTPIVPLCDLLDELSAKCCQRPDNDPASEADDVYAFLKSMGYKASAPYAKMAPLRSENEREDMSVSSLCLLSTQQALEDLAFFVLSMNKQHNFHNPKWITFGGSYPGALSAAFRSKYPELTVGAVASSVPLNQKLDFFEYAQVVEAVVTNTSAACARSITEAFSKMQQLATTKDGRQTLNRVFNLAPPFDEKTTKADVSNFFANIYNLFQGMIQYTYDGRNEDSKSNLTARKLCDIMTSSDAVVDNVYKLYNWYSIFYPPTNENITQFANSYADTINALKETNVSKMSEDTAAYRGWFWMACNEFGYMQTTDGGRGMFGSTIPINYFFDMCTDAFGSEFKAERIRDGNRAAMRFYGGQFFFKATNLLLPNGMYDPWSALGYYPSQDQAAQNVFAVKIEGATHCSDMYPPYDGESASVTAARAFIESKLRAFLTEPEPAPPTPSESPDSSSSWMSTVSPQPNAPTPETTAETTTSTTHGVLIVLSILAATISALQF